MLKKKSYKFKSGTETTVLTRNKKSSEKEIPYWGSQVILFLLTPAFFALFTLAYLIPSPIKHLVKSINQKLWHWKRPSMALLKAISAERCSNSFLKNTSFWNITYSLSHSLNHSPLTLVSSIQIPWWYVFLQLTVLHALRKTQCIIFLFSVWYRKQLLLRNVYLKYYYQLDYRYSEEATSTNCGHLWPHWQDFAHVVKACSNNPISCSFNTKPLVFAEHWMRHWGYNDE